MTDRQFLIWLGNCVRAQIAEPVDPPQSMESQSGPIEHRLDSLEERIESLEHWRGHPLAPTYKELEKELEEWRAQVLKAEDRIKYLEQQPSVIQELEAWKGRAQLAEKQLIELQTLPLDKVGGSREVRGLSKEEIESRWETEARKQEKKALAAEGKVAQLQTQLEESQEEIRGWMKTTEELNKMIEGKEQLIDQHVKTIEHWKSADEHHVASLIQLQGQLKASNEKLDKTEVAFHQALEKLEKLRKALE